ncbi:hypothetical protein WR25_06393 [Diploscapter pachys]|uniref:Uncharacterized protein n=1 Tax=Diploscapter pachys TaxID=2018661 RepID=A0A2A2LZ24_9BILA|nr:hypothetical protein WR25_06393 [Diploscapter pachys]
MADGDVRKSRNLERRRETSRYAARDRRGKEADIFNDLKEVVPLVDDNTVTHLDRIALLRVAVTLCRLKKTAGNVLERTDSNSDEANQHTEDMLTECLDGFVMIVDSDGTILYITESVVLFLGLTQTDMSGRVLKEFLHPQDYETFCQLSTECNGELDQNDVRTAVLRLKTVISPRGRTLNLKSALFKPVTFTVHGKRSTGGHVLLMQASTIPAGQGGLSSAAQNSTKMSDSVCGTFMTRHTCDMRVSYASDRLNQFIHKEPRSLIGSSFYDLVHPEDIEILAECIKELLSKGHIRTPYYRLIASDGSAIWVTSEASTVAHTTKGTKGQYIICLHCVLGVQQENEELIVCTDSDPNGLLCQRVKEELIDELQEYEGRQPEIIECVNFTSLVGPDEFEKLNPVDMPASISSIPKRKRAAYAEHFLLYGCAPSNENELDDGPSQKKRTRQSSRKGSYDEVLQWLFLDKPHSPAPAIRSAHAHAAAVNNPYAGRRQPHASSRGSTSVDVIRRSVFQNPSVATSRVPPSSRLINPVVDRISRNANSVGRSNAPANRNIRPVAAYRSASASRCVPAVQTSGALPLRKHVVRGAVQSPVPASDSTARLDAFFNAIDAATPLMGQNRPNPVSQQNNPSPKFSNDLAQNQQQQPPRNTKVIIDDLEWEEPDLSFYAPYIEPASADQQLSGGIQPLQFCDPPLDFFDKFIQRPSPQQSAPVNADQPLTKQARYDTDSGW